MSVSPYAAPLHLAPRPSPRLRALMLAAFCACAAGLAALPLPAALRVAVGAALLPALSLTWRRHPALSGAAVVVTWDADDRWWWRERGGEIELRLEPDSYLTPHLVILLLRQDPHRRVLLLTSDCVDPEQLRRLRVCLRARRPGAAAQDGVSPSLPERNSSISARRRS